MIYTIWHFIDDIPLPQSLSRFALYVIYKQWDYYCYLFFGIKVGQKVVYIFLVLLFLAYFVLLPLFKIIIGLNSINECPLNTSIPYWLMIDGVFIVLLALSIFLFKYFDCSLMASVISLFLFSWLIRGKWIHIRVFNLIDL